MQTTKIEWTDKSWNPVTGCTKISQGCKNCYAERLYERFNGQGSFKKITCHPERLMQPLKWKKPCKIFVNSMSDLFHEDVPFEFIQKCFSIMTCYAHRHTYQILTKRPQRMLDFIKWLKQRIPGWKYFSNNIWIGVSVENQDMANERIPLLVQVPASVKFLSCEPLLGFIFFRAVSESMKDIQWVIVGGESGPGARPMHPDWAFEIKQACVILNTPFFFKQQGEYIICPDEFDIKKAVLVKNGALQEYMLKVGKKNAGRLLFGNEYSEFPNEKNNK
jgi:protein gp37